MKHRTERIVFLFFMFFSITSCHNNSLADFFEQYPPANGLSPKSKRVLIDLLSKKFHESITEDHFAFLKEFNQEENDDITAYKKIKLNGSKNFFYLIEYSFPFMSMAGYPGKYQFLMDGKGKFIEIFNAKRFELVEIFPKQEPFLLLVHSTAKGNGGHVIYKIKNNELALVFTSHDERGLFRTYDAHRDVTVNEPHELTLNINDENSDGFNDIIFSGTIKLLQALNPEGHWFDVEVVDGKEIMYNEENPWKTIPVRLIFLYNPKSEIFEANEDYAITIPAMFKK